MNIQIKCLCKKNEGIWKPGHHQVVFLNFLSLGQHEREHGSEIKREIRLKEGTVLLFMLETQS